MENILLASIGIVALLVLVLGFFLFQLKKRMDLFFKQGDQDIEKLLSSQIKKTEKQKEDIKKIKEEIFQLNKISKLTFQKIGLIRFNPFNDVGGDQSFSVALLDSRNNGFVISSIYSRDGNRMYAKPVSKGKSQHSLSGEEKEAIKTAIA
ncbi:DUF4446 family protein [Patescibacteria group bacterium]